MNSFIADHPCRLLSFLKEKFQDFSTKDIKWAIEHNHVSINGFVERFSSSLLKKGDRVSFFPEKKPFFRLEPSRILYEDATLLAYDKPSYIDSESLANALKLLLVHRLDLGTTGVLLLAKTSQEADQMRMLFRERTIEKEYFAIVQGFFQKDLTISESLKETHPRQGTVYVKVCKQGEGLSAQTEVLCLKKNKKASLLLCKPFTGRTHQIRVHLKSVGNPILGDYEYGKKIAVPTLFRPLLHAKKLQFLRSDQENLVRIEAPLPADFLLWQKNLGL